MDPYNGGSGGGPQPPPGGSQGYPQDGARDCPPYQQYDSYAPQTQVPFPHYPQYPHHHHQFHHHHHHHQHHHHYQHHQHFQNQQHWGQPFPPQFLDSSHLQHHHHQNQQQERRTPSPGARGKGGGKGGGRGGDGIDRSENRKKNVLNFVNPATGNIVGIAPGSVERPAQPSDFDPDAEPVRPITPMDTETLQTIIENIIAAEDDENPFGASETQYYMFSITHRDSLPHVFHGTLAEIYPELYEHTKSVLAEAGFSGPTGYNLISGDDPCFEWCGQAE
eukprot:TRINITY_DN8427_c0_g1_i1.p2 TRINITY_DN8427_c0_g1~~TRINITY_DN8427_c0_g1_i1.p2  ORF type:complete len:277 (+),score=64.15 TRINITY_DN8427_c0_g1_i1:58-888(+)